MRRGVGRDKAGAGAVAAYIGNAWPNQKTSTRTATGRTPYYDRLGPIALARFENEPSAGPVNREVGGRHPRRAYGTRTDARKRGRLAVTRNGELQEAADEEAKEVADEEAKEVADEAAKEAADEAYKDTYEEVYAEVYSEAYEKAYKEALDRMVVEV